jgi:hypothetical protein
MVSRFRFSFLSTVTPAVSLCFQNFTFRPPLLGDGTEKILPTPGVGANDALLLRFTPCALDARATVSSSRCSIASCPCLLSLLQSSHRGLARAPIICSHFPHGNEHVITCVARLFFAS